MSTCATCKHCKARVGLLKRWDYCTKYATPSNRRCVDYVPRLLGKSK